MPFLFPRRRLPFARWYLFLHEYLLLRALHMLYWRQVRSQRYELSQEIWTPIPIGWIERIKKIIINNTPLTITIFSNGYCFIEDQRPIGKEWKTKQKWICRYRARTKYTKVPASLVHNGQLSMRFRNHGSCSKLDSCRLLMPLRKVAF